ncbi:MAG: hypothetical protein ACTHMM_16655 [Agriterribacter sp.]
MPINSIIEQPLGNSLRAAYRPIRISVNAQSTSGSNVVPPVVYCDIYFGGIYYKTISKTQYSELRLLSGAGEDPAWLVRYDFDIQDLCQEYLKFQLAPFGGSDIVDATNVIANVFCRLRSSGYNSVGFIEPEGTPPVQATGRKAATAGTGLETNTFAVVNATLQHLHNQDLTTHLNAYKTGTWAPDAWPLTHRSKGEYKACENQSDYFPILYAGSRPIKCFKIHYRYTGESEYREEQFCMPVPCALINITNITQVDNGNDTQTIAFAWDALPVNVTAVAIKYRMAGGGDDDWVASEVAATSPQYITLPLGKFDFILQTKGDCIPNDGPIQENIGISNACEAVSFGSSTELPPAVAFQPYNFSITLNGTAPFFLLYVSIKPAWMTVALSGNQLILSGTPSLSNVGSFAVYAQLFNCQSPSNMISLAGSIVVTAPVASQNELNITIKPGGNWTPPNPYDNCYSWRGTLSVMRETDNVEIFLEEWTSHDPTNVPQIETAAISNLPDGNYILSWSFSVFVACAPVGTSVRYFETFAPSLQKSASDTKVVNLTGGVTKVIRIEVEKSE